MKGKAASCFSSTFTVPVQTLCQVYIPGVSSLHCPFELSSLEELEEMDRQRLQAIESLKISDDSVKCQRYGNAVPIVGKLTRTS